MWSLQRFTFFLRFKRRHGFQKDIIKNGTQKHLRMIDSAVESYKTFGVCIIEKTSVFDILVLEIEM
jgi:hypothetical protein